MQPLKNLKIDKMHSVTVDVSEEYAEIKFHLKQYKGMEFSIELKQGIFFSCGCRAFKKSFDGFDCELTNRQRNNCIEWLDKNSDDLIHYFVNDCTETKLPLLFAVE